MKAIVTHDVADFDGFASAVAVTKLLPDAVIVLRRAEAPALRAYLTLHKDRFPYQRVDELDQGSVSRLIVVDVRRRSRLAHFEALLQRSDVVVDVWDHHPAAEDDIDAARLRVQPLGAVTTLLVETLRDRGIALDTEEATLLALGIHDDTGSLTYDTTTTRDAAALCWLTERGANPGVLRRYLRPALADAQREALVDALAAAEPVRAGGSVVGVARLSNDTMIEGLGPVVSRALALSPVAAVFVVLAVGTKKVQVTGRSQTPSVDVGRVLRGLGGGGHAGAGSATLRGTDADDVERRLRAAVAAEPGAPTIPQLMSTPVVTIAPTMPLVDVEHMLQQREIAGTVVVAQDGTVVGMLSRRDLARAKRDGRMHLQARSCHRPKVISIDAGAALQDAIACMVEHGIGRLPVLRDGTLVGLLSRSDLRALLYPASPSQ